VAVAQRRDPYLSFQFAVEIDQQVIAGFSEITGLTQETEMEKFHEGGVNHYEQQLPGLSKFPSNLILKRGLCDDALWSWYKDVTMGCIYRKAVGILLLDSAGEEQLRWAFRKACPVKWVGPEFRAGRAEVAFESIELVHNGPLSD
jgi:phage tail-like protein